MSNERKHVGRILTEVMKLVKGEINGKHDQMSVLSSENVSNVWNIINDPTIAKPEESGNWQYSLFDPYDHANYYCILLKKYIGTDPVVNIYGKYNVNNTVYRSKINPINTIADNSLITAINIKDDVLIPANEHTYMGGVQFCNLPNLTFLSGLEHIDLSESVTLAKFLYNLPKLSSVDISLINTSAVTDMSQMFYGCKSLMDIYGLKDLNVSNVTTMQGMFSGCAELFSVVLPNWNTSNVTNMANMFRDCKKLKHFYTSHDSSSVTKFNTSNVTTMEGMFSGCSSLESLDLTDFDMRKVTSTVTMFYNCTNLREILVSRDKWILPSGCNKTAMFIGCGCSEVTYVD